MPKIMSIGHLCVDITAKPVDSIPPSGQLSAVDSMTMTTGGCGNNCVNDMAKIGMDVGIIGKIGQDGFGDFLYSALKENGVNTDQLVRDPDLPTSASVVLMESSGQRTFLHCYGANTSLKEEDIDFEAFKDTKIAVYNAVYLLPALDGEPAARVLKKLQEMGVYTVVDTAWDPTGSWMKKIAPCLPYMDLFIPSIEEAEMIAGTSDLDEIADCFLKAGVKNVVIKAGSKGAFIKNANMREMVPSFLIENPVDTTGAGDSFVAGFTTGLAMGWDMKTCAIFANGVGANCVMGVGASSGIKPMNEIIDFIKTRKPDFEIVMA